MLTASIVIYKTQKEEFRKIVECSLKSSIHTIFIVDNSPSNKLQEVVASYRSSRLIYIWGQGNIGYGAGHNIAINKSFESDANYHIILNPDVIFQPEVIESLFLFMEKHSEVGAVMPNIIYPNGTPQRLCKLLSNPFRYFRKKTHYLNRGQSSVIEGMKCILWDMIRFGIVRIFLAVLCFYETVY